MKIGGSELGLNNADAARCVIDIETYPLEGAAEYLEPVSAPSNYKDEAKIAAYCAEKMAEQVQRAALDLDLCRIVAVGWWQEGEPEPSVLVGEKIDEDVMLSSVWAALKLSISVVGYNLLGFDLPVLIRRSQYEGIVHPAVNLDRYRTPHVDLQERLSFNGKFKWRSLDFYAKRFGVECLDDPYTGADIGRLVEAGDWAAVSNHCRSDIVKTARLAARLGYFTLPAPVEMEF